MVMSLPLTISVTPQCSPHKGYRIDIIAKVDTPGGRIKILINSPISRSIFRFIIKASFIGRMLEINEHSKPLNKENTPSSKQTFARRGVLINHLKRLFISSFFLTLFSISLIIIFLDMPIFNSNIRLPLSYTTHRLTRRLKISSRN